MNETKLNLKYHDKIQNCIDKRYCELWALQLNDNTLMSSCLIIDVKVYKFEWFYCFLKKINGATNGLCISWLFRG